MEKLGLTLNKPMKKNKLIAITGGIGSGKTYALNVLKMAGYNVLSADQITFDLYQKRSVKKLLKKMFPTAVTGKCKLTVDKKEIADIAFSNKVKYEELTSTVTPLVLKEIKKRTKRLKGLVFVEVPLLFERGYQNEFDFVLVITRPLEERIESVKTRSKLNEKEILARVNAQVDYDKLDLSNYTVIENDGGKAFKELLLAFPQQLME